MNNEHTSLVLVSKCQGKKQTGSIKQVNRKRKRHFYVCRNRVTRKRVIRVILWLNLYPSFLLTCNEYVLVSCLFELSNWACRRDISLLRSDWFVCKRLGDGDLEFLFALWCFITRLMSKRQWSEWKWLRGVK